MSFLGVLWRSMPSTSTLPQVSCDADHSADGRAAFFLISLYQVVPNDSLVQSLSRLVFLRNYRDQKRMLTLIFLLSKETQQNHNFFTQGFIDVRVHSIKYVITHWNSGWFTRVRLIVSILTFISRSFAPKRKLTDQNNMLMRTTPFSDHNTKL